MIGYGLVGERLGHSFSPEIHRVLGGYDYELIEISRDKIDDFFKARAFRGLNVTIPYKETVIPHLDEIDSAAREIGAVNTVVMRDGHLCGFNTDWIGMQRAILRAGIEIDGKKVLICGTGGTSKTALYVAKQLGAAEIYRISREKKEGCITYDEAYRDHTDAGVIINTTPCGMFPDNFSTAVNTERFPSLTGVFDAVFNPLRTKLVIDAEYRGVKAAGGLFMLVSQAKAASEIFRGIKCGKGADEAIYKKLLQQKENIVLIGMPSSGKTTVGKELASKLGRELIDIDAEIVRSEGRTIAEIFAACGEEYFREAEQSAIREISRRQGIIIATGGGAVLCRSNIDALRQNGRIYFLDRDLQKLIATSDRPLSSDRAALETRYRERIDIYNEVCDVKIDSNGSIGDAVSQIKNDFENKEKS